MFTFKITVWQFDHPFMFIHSQLTENTAEMSSILQGYFLSLYGKKALQRFVQVKNNIS